MECCTISLEPRAGLGMELKWSIEGRCFSLAAFYPMKGQPGPAEQAGEVKVGANLIRINDQPLAGLKKAAILAMLRENDKQRVLTFTRHTVPQPRNPAPPAPIFVPGSPIRCRRCGESMQCDDEDQITRHATRCVVYPETCSQHIGFVVTPLSVKIDPQDSTAVTCIDAEWEEEGDAAVTERKNSSSLAEIAVGIEEQKEEEAVMRQNEQGDEVLLQAATSCSCSAPASSSTAWDTVRQHVSPASESQRFLSELAAAKTSAALIRCFESYGGSDALLALASSGTDWELRRTITRTPLAMDKIRMVAESRRKLEQVGRKVWTADVATAFGELLSRVGVRAGAKGETEESETEVQSGEAAETFVFRDATPLGLHFITYPWPLPLPTPPDVKFVVKDVIEGGQAARVGVSPGDILLAIAGESTGGLRPAAMNARLEELGRPVVLTFRRPKHPLEHGSSDGATVAGGNTGGSDEESSEIRRLIKQQQQQQQQEEEEANEDDPNRRRNSRQSIASLQSMLGTDSANDASADSLETATNPPVTPAVVDTGDGAGSSSSSSSSSRSTSEKELHQGRSAKKGKTKKRSKVRCLPI